MSKFITNEEKIYVRSIFDDEYTDPLQKLLKVKAYLSLSKHKKLEQIAWVTINPDETKCSLLRFVGAMEKFTSRSCCIDPVYTYEQRGETEAELGKGFHSHLLFTKDSKVSPSEYKRNLESTFKDCVGNSKHIWIQYFPKSYHSDKLLYLQGKKWDEEKDVKIDMDILWRDLQDMKSIY